MTAGSWLTRALSVGQSAPIAVAILVAANLVPLIGVLWFGWDVGMILITYWLENGIVGLLNVFKILLATGERSPAAVRGRGRYGIAAFFGVHYGLFWVVHGVFVLLLTGRGIARGVLDPLGIVFSEPALVLAAAALLTSHAASFWLNFIGRREYLATSVDSQMWQPYPRMFVLHITIVLGGVFLIGQGQPIFALALLVVLKTAIDLFLHLREHRRAQSALPTLMT
ncbi:MAG: DUF6498-containing protein [Chloroflexota bacterium]